MDKLGLPLTDAALTWSHAHNTLVVSYAKPAQVMQAVSGAEGGGSCGRVCMYM